MARIIPCRSGRATPGRSIATTKPATIASMFGFNLDPGYLVASMCVSSVGFVLFSSVAVDAYNGALEPALEGYRLPDLGCAQALVLLVGNTRRLWPLFIAAYRGSPLGEQQHPLDAYSREHIGGGASRVAE